MNDINLISNIFKTFFNERGINISFYNKVTTSVVDYIQRGFDSLTPLGKYHNLNYAECSSTPELINSNIIEWYILLPCSNSFIKGTFICGPFIMEPLVSSKIKEVMRELKISPSKFSLTWEYLTSLPLIKNYQVKNLMCSMLGLTRLTLEDYRNLDLVSPLKEKTLASVPQKEDTLSNLWQYDVPIANIRDINKFYADLFSAETYHDRITVLGKYFYITEPFHHKNFPGDYDILRHVKSTALLFMGSTLSFALQYGLDSYTIINLSSDFAQRFEYASTVEEVTNLTNKMYITFSEKVYNIKRKNYSKLTNDIIAYISDNIQEKISLSDIGENTGYNESYISNFFKKETGSTIKKFILLKKIDVAKHLLKTSDISIGDLSEFLNFSSYNHFSSTFNSIVGCSPSDYRNDFSYSIKD